MSISSAGHFGLKHAAFHAFQRAQKTTATPTEISLLFFFGNPFSQTTKQSSISVNWQEKPVAQLAMPQTYLATGHLKKR
jgi:hypothetical protein